MIPGVGGVFSLAGHLAQYGISQKLAKEQKERADDLRNEAGQVKAPALRQEFRDVQRLKNLNSLSGIPGYAQYNEEINQDAANQMLAGERAASSGSDLLAYANATYSNANQAKRGLKADDANYRANAIGDYANTQWQIGNEQLKNEEIKRNQQDELLSRSASLEDASTANKWQGKSDVAGNIAGDLASVAGGAAGGLGGKLAAGKTATEGVTTTNDTEATRFDPNQSGLQFYGQKPEGQSGMVTVISPNGEFKKVTMGMLSAMIKQGYKLAQ